MKFSSVLWYSACGFLVLASAEGAQEDGCEAFVEGRRYRTSVLGYIPVVGNIIVTRNRDIYYRTRVGNSPRYSYDYLSVRYDGSSAHIRISGKLVIFVSFINYL